jgi:hypothetical protein
VYAIEHTGWKGQQGSSISSAPSARCFFDEWAAFHASQGWLRLHWLTVAGSRSLLTWERSFMASSLPTRFPISRLGTLQPRPVVIASSVGIPQPTRRRPMDRLSGVLDEATGGGQPARFQ